jgi:hypothetical protein
MASYRNNFTFFNVLEIIYGFRVWVVVPFAVVDFQARYAIQWNSATWTGVPSVRPRIPSEKSRLKMYGKGGREDLEEVGMSE